MAVVRELLIKWGFDVDDKQIQKLDNGIKNVKQSIFAIGAVGAAAAGTLFGLAQSTANAGDRARKTAQAIGLTTEALQELEFAGQIGGVSQQEMSMSIAKLARTASDAQRGLETYKRAYDELGISVTDTEGNLKSTDALLMEISDSFAQLPNGTKKTALAMELFGRSGARLIPTLNGGSEAIAKLREEARLSGAVISDNAGKAAEEFNDTIARLKLQLTGIKNVLGNELIPVITDQVKILIDWIKANREIVKQNLRKFIQGLLIVFKATVKFGFQIMKVISALSEVFGGLGNVLKGVIILFTAFAGAKFLMGIGQMTQAIFGLVKGFQTLRIGILLTNAAALAIPILIGAAVVAVALIIEDLIRFFRGENSVTAIIIDEWGDAWDWVVDKTIQTFNRVKEIINDALMYLQTRFPITFKVISFVLGLFLRQIKFIFGLFKNIFTGNLKGIKDQFFSVFGGIKDFLSGTFGKMFGLNINAENQATSPAATTANTLNRINNVRQGSQVSVQSPINITVNGAQDPKAVTDEMKFKLRDEMTSIFDARLFDAQEDAISEASY